MEEKKTACECPLAGFCNRHSIDKNAHWHKLCQNHTGYFKMWEECRGPGQEGVECEKTTQEEHGKEGEVIPEVSTIQMAKNFGAAMLAHAKSGFKNVSDEEQKRRLSICTGVKEDGSDKCPFFNEKKASCDACGCQVKFKAKLQSSHCPKNFW
jgi:hypothetical protein